MAEHVTVTVADLRAVLNRVMDATEARLGPEVLLAVDHYWHLPVEVAFDLAREPETLTVGRVSDDMESLQGSGDVTPETAWHDLSHLVGVLRGLEWAARP